MYNAVLWILLTMFTRSTLLNLGQHCLNNVLLNHVPTQVFQRLKTLGILKNQRTSRAGFSARQRWLNSTKKIESWTPSYVRHYANIRHYANRTHSSGIAIENNNRNLNNLISINCNSSPTKPKFIPKCLVINARSLAKPDAAPALHAELKSHKIDICFVSETWLHNKIPSHLVCPEDYIIVRKDRPGGRIGGGVAILCRHDWKISILNPEENDFENIWCRITTPNSEYVVSCVYHPPEPCYDVDHLLAFLSDTCDQILINDPNAKIIIAGDINQLNIQDLMSQHAFKQLVKTSTRGQRILDVFITNCPFLWKSASVHQGLVRSDHLAVVVSPSISAKPNRKRVTVRDTREHCKIDMDRRLEFHDWSIFDTIDDPADCVQLLNGSLWSLFNDSFPLITVKVSSRDPPYMSPLVKHLCNIRHKNIRSHNHDRNTALQERINHLIRVNQLNAVSAENKKHHKGSKGWWDTANRITGRKTKPACVSNVVNPDDINTYFQSINTDDAYAAPDPLPIPEGTRVPTVDENSVRYLLIHQKRTASGPDGIPYWFWRDYAHHLSPILTKIFNSSLQHQTVPALWKLANISPIPKETPFNACNQLRPISITDIIIRLFEKLVYKQELSTVLKSSIGCDQFAYKEGHNTTMALIKCYHKWLGWLDKDMDFVRVFTFDFSKAFDMVSHNIVCSKLKALGINPYIVNWIISFLSGRQQRVVVDGVTTNFLDINRGVPQGTVLGPLLFSILVNDIVVVNPSRNLLIKYADDITLSVPVKGDVPDQSAVAEVENIQRWATVNKMKLNLSKTWEMVAKGKTTKTLPEPITSIERKSELKLLGVTFNQDLTNWDTHIDSLLHKASSRLYILRVCKFYGYSLDELSTLFNSLILSLFMYAIEVWGGAFESKYIKRIDSFLKRAFKFGFTNNYIPFKTIIKNSDLKLWNNITKNCNHCLHNLLPEKRTRKLRNREHNYILPRVCTERFKRSFINRCLFDSL